MSFSEAPIHPFIPQHVFTEHLQSAALDAKMQQGNKDTVSLIYLKLMSYFHRWNQPHGPCTEGCARVGYYEMIHDKRCDMLTRYEQVRKQVIMLPLVLARLGARQEPSLEESEEPHFSPHCQCWQREPGTFLDTPDS